MEDKKMTIEQQIEVWKKKYDSVFYYEVDGKKCYLHSADRTVVAAAAALGKDDPFKFAEVVISNCWLDGDEELRTVDKYFMGLSQKINDLVEIESGALKKL